MKRIQRQRTKGWRMPEGAVYVGRPSRWGNPYTIAEQGWPLLAVQQFRYDLLGQQTRDPLAFAAWLEPLRGHDLACWCPLDQPCHTDVLLDLVNR